ncbi:MAG: hypothetical protein E6429_13345, partial [Staphylococcus sp.]|nr:hypothetical protein [Staphylococcus sp.]
INAGHEVWNNETKQTNKPPVFTWTPDPKKEVLASAPRVVTSPTFTSSAFGPARLSSTRLMLT